MQWISAEKSYISTHTRNLRWYLCFYFCYDGSALLHCIEKRNLCVFVSLLLIGLNTEKQVGHWSFFSSFQLCTVHVRWHPDNNYFEWLKMFYSSFSTVFLSFKLQLNPFPHPLISLYSCSALPLPFFHFLCDFIRLQYNCYSAEFSEKCRNLFVGNCKKSDFPRSTYVIAFCYFTTSHSSPSNTFKVFAPKKSDPSCLDSSLLLSFYPPVWIPLKYLEYEVLGINRAHMSTRVFFRELSELNNKIYDRTLRFSQGLQRCCWFILFLFFQRCLLGSHTTNPLVAFFS